MLLHLCLWKHCVHATISGQLTCSTSKWSTSIASTTVRLLRVHFLFKIKSWKWCNSCWIFDIVQNIVYMGENIVIFDHIHVSPSVEIVKYMWRDVHPGGRPSRPTHRWPPLNHSDLEEDMPHKIISKTTIRMYIHDNKTDTQKTSVRNHPWGGPKGIITIQVWHIWGAPTTEWKEKEKEEGKAWRRES